MTSDAKRLYRTLLVALGGGIGTLSTSLAFEIAPKLVRFKDGIDPTLQGALVGACIVGLGVTAAALIEVEQ